MEGLIKATVCVFAVIIQLSSFQTNANAIKEVVPVPNSCDLSTQFPCTSSGSCIPLANVCDEFYDCHDKSDESPIIKDCNLYLLSNCSVETEFLCKNKKKCINREFLCDGDKDCSDGSDEPPFITECPEKPTPTKPTCTEGQFQCEKTGKCLEKDWVCDGSHDCGDDDDKSDEPPSISDCSVYRGKCKETEFQCSNTRCTALSNLCDLSDDCGDNSDESTCKPFACKSPALFTCKVTGKCIFKSKLCDGDTTDCGDDDKSDEEGCLDYNKCPPDTFACNSSGITKCFPDTLKCDGTSICDDAADELNCPPLTPKYANGTYCDSDEFECKNHKCISLRDLCDEIKDCTDGLDESPEICDAKFKWSEQFHATVAKLLSG